jgi:hypothetical protein
VRWVIGRFTGHLHQLEPTFQRWPEGIKPSLNGAMRGVLRERAGSTCSTGLEMPLNRPDILSRLTCIVFKDDRTTGTIEG